MRVNNDELIGSRIANLRGAMSQQELARRMTSAGVKWSQSTVWSVESGRRALRYSEAVPLCEILGVQLSDLRGDIDAVLSAQFASRMMRHREVLTDVLAESMTRTADAAIAADAEGLSDYVLTHERDEVFWTLIDDAIENFVSYATSEATPEIENPGPIWRAILDEWDNRAALLRTYLAQVEARYASRRKVVDGERQETS